MGESAALSPVPSAGRTVLHGTSQLLLKGWFSFIRNLESTNPDLSLSLCPELPAQEKAWVTYSFSSVSLLLLRPSPPPLKFYKLMTVCMCSADGQKTWKEFLDFSPPVCLIWITCWKLKLAPIALCLQGGPVGQSVVPSEYRAPSGMWVMLMWLARALGVGWGANYYFFGHDLFPLPFFFFN